MIKAPIQFGYVYRNVPSVKVNMFDHPAIVQGLMAEKSIKANIDRDQRNYQFLGNPGESIDQFRLRIYNVFVMQGMA